MRKKLQHESNRLWTEHYASAEDSGRLDLLAELCKVDDRLTEIRTTIKHDGITAVTLKGRALAHPLLALEATFSAMYARLLRVIVAPLRGPGRPTKDSHDASELAKFRRRKIEEQETRLN